MVAGDEIAPPTPGKEPNKLLLVLSHLVFIDFFANLHYNDNVIFFIICRISSMDRAILYQRIGCGFESHIRKFRVSMILVFLSSNYFRFQ